MVRDVPTPVVKELITAVALINVGKDQMSENKSLKI